MEFFRCCRSRKGQLFSADAAAAVFLAVFILFVGMRAISMQAEQAAESGEETKREFQALALADYLLRAGAVETTVTAYGDAGEVNVIDSARLAGIMNGAFAELVGGKRACAEFVRVRGSANCTGGTCIARPALEAMNGKREAGYLVSCVE